MDPKWKAALVAGAAMLSMGYLLTLVPSERLFAPEEIPELAENTPTPTASRQGGSQSAPSASDTPAHAAEAADDNELERGGVLEMTPPLAADPGQEPEAHVREAKEAELRERFNQAAVMLHAGEYDFAVKALHRVLALAPRLPEAHVNMGFALLGMESPAAAADFFSTAIELNPYQANAYYGLAVAMEALEDREGALGAMRSFIHLAGESDQPYKARARSALWEWQAQAQADREPLVEPEGAGS